MRSGYIRRCALGETSRDFTDPTDFLTTNVVERLRLLWRVGLPLLLKAVGRAPTIPSEYSLLLVSYPSWPTIVSVAGGDEEAGMSQLYVAKKTK